MTGSADRNEANSFQSKKNNSHAKLKAGGLVVGVSVVDYSSSYPFPWSKINTSPHRLRQLII